METSILTTIKKMLGISSTYLAFDTDIIIGINSALAVLFQLGLGSSPFKITGTSETWSDLLGNRTDVEEVKQYIYLRVKRIFDPPASSGVLNVIDAEIKEYESRINYTVDIPEEDQNV